MTTTITYTYGSIPGPTVTNIPTPPGDNQLSVENSIVYKDSNGAILRTVVKGWLNPYELGCKLDELDNNLIGGVFYDYGQGAQIRGKKEYDYGVITSTSVCQNGSTAPSGITPARETVTNYQGFSDTPIYPYGASIFDKPCQTITYGSGSRVAETDSFYDNGAPGTVCGPAGTPSVSVVSRCARQSLNREPE